MLVIRSLSAINIYILSLYGNRSYADNSHKIKSSYKLFQSDLKYTFLFVEQFYVLLHQ